MRAAAATAADPDSIAIVIGGSGNGEQIAANKIAGIRAALVWSEETARLARLHNDANVLSLGARMYPADDAIAFTQVFLATPFSGEARHVRRLEMIAEYERCRGAAAAPRLGMKSRRGGRGRAGGDRLLLSLAAGRVLRAGPAAPYPLAAVRDWPGASSCPDGKAGGCCGAGAASHGR